MIKILSLLCRHIITKKSNKQKSRLEYISTKLENSLVGLALSIRNFGTLTKKTITGKYQRSKLKNIVNASHSKILCLFNFFLI